MKCMFDLGIECPVYDAQKELGYQPHPNGILEDACPQCPHRLNKLKK